VRGWLRRARLNAEHIRASATIAVHALDPMAAPIAPTGSVLADMVDAVGRAVQAAVVRLGPLRPPLQWAVLLTAGGILAPPRPPPARLTAARQPEPSSNAPHPTDATPDEYDPLRPRPHRT